MSETNYEEITSTRKCGHEGVEEFLWITEDTGAYGHENDGPLHDWIVNHEDIISNVRKFDVVVQAGGNCGMYARFYKNYFKEVYTFEPDDINFYCLNKNCEGIGYHKYLGGLGNNTEKYTLSVRSKSNVGTHRIEENPGEV